MRRTCDRVVVLNEGLVRFDGDTDEGIALLHELLEDHETSDESQTLAEIVDCDLFDGSGARTRTTTSSETLHISTDARLLVDVDDVWVSVLIYDAQGAYVYGETRRMEVGRRAGQRVRIDVDFEARLATGSYRARMLLATPDGEHTTWVLKVLEFFVGGRPRVAGVADLHATFAVEPAESTEEAGR